MPRRNSGFTIVELMVVVVILGILVGLTAFGYRGWQQGITQREVQSDLRMASTAMENEKNFSEGYPTALPANFKQGNGVNVTYGWGDATRYCIQGVSNKLSSATYHVNSSVSKEPQTGSCSSSPFPPAAPSPSAVASSSSAINVTWADVSNATSYVVRYGTSSPTTVASCTSSPCALTGLAQNTAYSISVAATNSAGSSTAATASATTYVLPGTPAPSLVALTTTSINVTWPAVSDATSYSVRYGTSSPTTVAACTTSPCALTGLTSTTTYYIAVIATNSYGSSNSATVNTVTCGGASYRLVRTGLPAGQGNFFTLHYTRSGGSNTNYPGQFLTGGTGPYTFDQTMTALCPGAPYSYTLIYRDNLGSILTTFPGSFNTP